MQKQNVLILKAKKTETVKTITGMFSQCLLLKLLKDILMNTIPA